MMQNSLASKDLADYFERLLLSKNTKTLANLLISEIFRFIDLEDLKSHSQLSTCEW